MDIDWAALGSVFGVSLVVTVALVGFFTLGIVGLSKASSGAQGGGSGVAAKAAATSASRSARRRSPTGSTSSWPEGHHPPGRAGRTYAVRPALRRTGAGRPGCGAPHTLRRRSTVS